MQRFLQLGRKLGSRERRRTADSCADKGFLSGLAAWGSECKIQRQQTVEGEAGWASGVLRSLPALMSERTSDDLF